MMLVYTLPDGKSHQYALTAGKAVTIGRSPAADVVIQDEKASRLHCGIRYESGRYFIRDLKSKNGTYVNEERVESAELEAGDRFRVGSVVFRLESDPGPGPDTALHEVEEQMADGKGYGTILREIVDAVDPETRATRPSSPPPDPEDPEPS